MLSNIFLPTDWLPESYAIINFLYSIIPLALEFFASINTVIYLDPPPL